MDQSAANCRPLLQQSTDDDDDNSGSDVDYLAKHAAATASSNSAASSGSTAVTRRLTGSTSSSITMDPEAVGHNDAVQRRLECGRSDEPTHSRTSSGHDDDEEDDDEDDDDEHSVSVNLAKELLRNENAPRDRFGFTYIVFYLLGMTTLLPWNFFITAEDYWMYKFRDVTNCTDPTTLTPIQAGFTADLSVASAVPSTLFLILNAFVGHRIPLALRMCGSMVVVMVFFVVTTVLVEVDTDGWQTDFFALTLGSVVVMNVATAILSGGLFGISGQFPSEYVTAVVSGQALGGIFAALTEIVSLTFGASATTSAFVYFMIGNAVLLLSLVCYVVAARTAFFRYFTVERLALVKAATVVVGRRRAVMDAEATTISGGCAAGEPQFGVVLRKIWAYGFAEWLVFAVTLSVYPAVTVLVTSQNHGNGHPWNDIYFLPVVNYLVFNSGDYLGRILAGMIEWPRNKPLLVVAMAVLRIAFVPALIVCNANPRHTFPTLIHADYVFIILMAVFSFTNGYLANIALIWAPKSVPSREREMASSMMAAFLGIGLAFGSSISLIMVQIV